jgi:hypothetical protein
MAPQKTDWQAILVRAAQIVRSYDTSVTLRQLYYRLVSEQLFPNVLSSYKGLSAKTAQARREGWFPSLIDPGRSIQRYRSFDGPEQARDWLKQIYLRNRTEGQEFAIYLGVEKAGMVQQLQAWFGEDLGIPILALGGYSSQSYVEQIQRDVERDGRSPVLIYAGDLDPSGEDIDRDFELRTDCWSHVRRVALLPEHVEEYGLPPLPGKATDSRAQGFIDRHGSLFQVELDALPPEDLRRLFQDELDQWWDEAAHEEILETEDRERATL